MGPPGGRRGYATRSCGRIEKAARQYPAASRAQNLLVRKSPVRPGCNRFALASDCGESKLLFRSKEQTSRCDLDTPQRISYRRKRARPNWSIAGERLLIDSKRTAAGGQTEFPYGCGRVEENWRAGSRCRCPGRVAGDLLFDGCGGLDDHDRDHALQGLAAVKGRNLSASALI